MPKSQPVDSSNDIAALWGRLLENISSLPTKSLLRQWANPVELSSEKVVISINSENLLKQFLEGNKRQILSDAVNALFNHTNIVVRLPQPDDKPVKEKTPAPKSNAAPPPPVSLESPVEDLPAPEEIEEAKAEAEEKIPAHQTMRSDMVNMVVDLFDGKFLD